MRATATLYKSCKIIPEKNFIVEGLSNYLRTLENIQFSNINYFKFDKLKTTLKLQLSQAYIECFTSNDLNYLKIQNDPTDILNPDTRAYFYFITNKVWKSENCIELELLLDSANTYTFNVDYSVGAKTKVIREHRDRYKTQIFSDSVYEINSSVLCTNFDSEEFMYFAEFDLPSSPELIGLSDYIIEKNNFTNVSLNTTTGVLHVKVFSTRDDIPQNYWIEVFGRFGSALVKNIDFVDEGINPVLYRGNEQEIIKDINTSWNLIYRNAEEIDPQDFNQVNPVECFLAPDTPIKIKTGTATKTLSYSNLTIEVYYYIAPSNNNYETINLKDNSNNEYSLSYSKVEASGYTNESMKWIILHRVSGQNYFSVEYHTYTKIYNGSSVQFEENKILFTATGITSINIISNLLRINYATGLTNSFALMTPTISGYWSYSMSDQYVNSLLSLDKTDSKLIKIIKLPYSPSEYTLDANNNILMSSIWNYDSTTTFFKLNDLSTKFKYEFETFYTDPLNTLLITPSNISVDSAKDIEKETKLLHSEFTYSKFVYDSFSFPFALEKVDINKYKCRRSNSNFKLGFAVTTTINSKFMFYFPNYILQNYKKNEDYDNILPIARNNEVVLYNNQYINYLRTGYNYDLKNKNRVETTSGVTTALGIMGAVASVGLGLASGNPAIAVGGVIGGVSSMTSSIVNNINTIASTESSLASKIEQLKNQATSVKGSDDIDLLEAYSNNRAKLTRYRVSDKMEKALFDLFYYCGYNTNEMKTPVINSRYWFNFLQAELDITASSNLPSFVIDDIKERFKIGVTILHNQTKNGANVWDFNQEKENWEVALLGGNN